jgi:hypothetical protein
MTQIRVHGQHRVRGYFSWAVIGVPLDSGKVMVLASNTLSQVQLEAELDSMDDLFDYRYRFVPDTHYSMSAVIKNVYIVYADTWADALIKLFGSGEWDPDRSDGPLELPAQSSQ